MNFTTDNHGSLRINLNLLVDSDFFVSEMTFGVLSEIGIDIILRKNC